MRVGTIVGNISLTGDRDPRRLAKPCANRSARYSAMRSPSTSGDAYWSRIRLKPRCAARRIEASLPAATQNGGCGCCAGGGSTTISSNCQNFPWCEKRRRDTNALRHHLDGFVEPRLRLFRPDAKAGEFVVPIALANAEIEPAAGDQIERGRLLSQQHRIVPGQHDHGSAEPQRLVRMASAVCSIKVAETWFQPVKWCSTRKLER